MPTLDQPDTSIYGQIQLPKLLSITGQQSVGRASAGPNAAMTKLAIEQQKEQQIQQLAQQYLSDPNNPDYDGFVKARAQIDPDGALANGKALEEWRQNLAKTDVEQSSANQAKLESASIALRQVAEQPGLYTPEFRAGAVKQFGPLADKVLPATDDPDAPAKIVNVLTGMQPLKDYLKGRTEAVQQFADGKKVEGALGLLGISNTPELWASNSKQVKAMGMGALLDGVHSPEEAQSRLAAYQAQQPQKAGEEKGGQAKEGMYKGKRTFGVFDPNTNTFNVDGQQVSASEFRPIPPQSAMGGGGTPTMSTPEIKPGTAWYRTAQDIAYGKLSFSQLRTLLSGMRGQNAADKKLALYDLARQLNPNYNPAQFEMGYKYAGNPKTQNTLVSIDNALSNFDKAVEVSNALDRTDLPGINKLLATGKFQFGNRPVTNFQQLQTILGDDIALAIGQGAPSDYKTKLAQSLLNGNLSKDNFISTLRQAGEFLQNRKQSILKQEGIYGTPEFNPSAAAVVPKVMGGGEGFSVQAPNGKTYKFTTQEKADAFKKAAGIQ